MHEPTTDERMRELQRIAYGAVATEAQRAAALAELEALRRQHEVADAPAAAAGEPPPLQVAGTLPEPVPNDVVNDSARPLKWAIAVGTAALLVGVAVGWHFGTRLSSAESLPPAPSPGASVSLSVGSVLPAAVPVAGSAAYAVFDRPATPADVPPLDLPDEWRASADPRLLATMPDGMTVYAAKPPGAAIDVCLLTVVPGQPGFGLSCTQHGSFEQGRLSYEFAHDRGGMVEVTLHADGSVQVGGPTQ